MSVIRVLDKSSMLKLLKKNTFQEPSLIVNQSNYLRLALEIKLFFSLVMYRDI